MDLSTAILSQQNFILQLQLRMSEHYTPEG